MTEQEKNEALQKEYTEEYKKLISHLNDMIENTSACYFVSQSNNATIIYEVKKCLTISKTYELKVLEDHSRKLEEHYVGNYAPKNSVLTLSLAEADASDLFNKIEEKLKSYTQQSYVLEQNQIVVNVIKQANADFESEENNK